MLRRVVFFVTVLRAVGRFALSVVAEVGRVARFSVTSLAGALSSPEGVSAASVQALVLFSRCAVPIALVTAPIGAMLSLQGLAFMRSFGVERSLAPLIVVTLVREIAPGFCAVVVAMQGGAGIAAELGTMRQRDELDALSVMGLDARALVAGPRILGAAIAVPLLNGIAVLCGVAGAYAASVLWLDVAHAPFVDGMWAGVDALDIWLSESKALIFGCVLGSICASAGFFATRGPAGVGEATNRAVVTSVVVILFCNYLFNTAIFGLRLEPT